MKTFGLALEKATDSFIITGKTQYIIYNHLKCKYRISTKPKYGINEELANYVNTF